MPPVQSSQQYNLPGKPHESLPPLGEGFPPYNKKCVRLRGHTESKLLTLNVTLLRYVFVLSGGNSPCASASKRLRRASSWLMRWFTISGRSC